MAKATQNRTIDKQQVDPFAISGDGRTAVRGESERFGTVVIGGGQSGLSVGYHLARRGESFVILEANNRIGDSWRSRWDSLRLFTPARYDGLVGLPFPAAPHYFPTKDEMADYLENYANHFQLPVRTGMRVDHLSRNGSGFNIQVGDKRIYAENVVIAMASYQKPVVPSFSAALNPDIVQLHSSEYRNPAQLREGGVLIVGAGNSGSEIAMETAPHHPTWMSGRSTGEIPFRIDGFAGRLLLVRLALRFLFHRVITVNTPIGRKLRPKVISQGGPLIRVKAKDMVRAGIKRVTRVAGVHDGLPMLEDQKTLDVTNVIWCTGFEPGFSWIDLPVLGQKEPLHESGLVPTEPGLYFVGLHFLHSLSSGMIHAVGRDAERVVNHLATRASSQRAVRA